MLAFADDDRVTAATIVSSTHALLPGMRSFDVPEESRAGPWHRLIVHCENCQMLLPPPTRTHKVQALAAQLGCTVNDFSTPGGHMRPALLGSTAGFAAALQEFGGLWDPTEKVYMFANWPTLEAALQHVIDERSAAKDI